MKVGIIIGSHRKNSQSGKVGRYIESRLHARGITTYLLSLEDNPIPLYIDNKERRSEIFSDYSEHLGTCTSFIVITPEWNGMATPAIKNFFLYASKNELGFKPALLCAVSSGRGGAYPISEMRASSYKNTRINYLPEHLIFRHVETTLNTDTPENENDEYMRKRTEYALDVLQAYDTIHSRLNRESLLRDDFGNGM